MRATPLYPSKPHQDHHIPPASAYSAVSLFSGCGGLDLGAERTEAVKTVWALDNEPWAVRTYRKNFGPHIWNGDIREVEFPKVPCDILLAGPPCQDFSSVWNHDVEHVAEMDMFQEVARFLHQRQPKAFVIENVPGLLSANNGEAWIRVRQALRAPSRFCDAPGPRYEVSAQVVNFADLGVPQNRSRLIILGIRHDIGIRPPEIPLPMRGRHRTVGDALDADPIPPDAPNHETGLDGEDVVERLKLIAPGENYSAIPKDHPLYAKGFISHFYRRLDPGRPSYTIIAGGGGGTHGYHHAHPRRLSNRERARLQSFPDDFVFEGGDGRSAYPRVRRQIWERCPAGRRQGDRAGVGGCSSRSSCPGHLRRAHRQGKALGREGHGGPVIRRRAEAQRLVKSKRRVADHGEVFTPDWMVEDMLDLVKRESERIDSRVLEPSCGSGNFLVPVLARKLATVQFRHGRSEFEKRHYALFALMCVYGIEILEDNAEECRDNLAEVFITFLGIDDRDEWARAARAVLAVNIVQGDALTMTVPGGKPITFPEWGYLVEGKYQRRDFLYDDLTRRASYEGTLFGELDDDDLFVPAHTYPAMTVRQIAEAAA